MERDVRFERRPECDLHANLFAPAGDLAGWRDVAFLHVHGGVWNRGERGFFDDRCRAVAERGFPTLTVDYRLSGDATYPAALHDVETAIRWVRSGEAFGVAPERVMLVGHSAGAHLAALAASTGDEAAGLAPDDGYGDASTAVDGVVCFDGPYDLLGAEPGGETADFIGCDPTDDPERYREASPRERATADHPPTLLYHADDDEWLTRRETRAYRDTLACHGVDVELRTPPGDHFFFTEPPWFDRTVEQTIAFADRVS